MLKMHTVLSGLTLKKGLLISVLVAAVAGCTATDVTDDKDATDNASSSSELASSAPVVSSSQAVSVSSSSVVSTDNSSQSQSSSSLVSSSSSVSSSSLVSSSSSVSSVKSSSSLESSSSVKSSSSSSVSESSAPAIEWKHCANGQEVCYFEGRSQVRFGAQGEWVTKTATNSIGCNTRDFGGDPLPGVKKTCQVPKATKVKSAPKPPSSSGELEPLSEAKVLFSRQLVARSHVSDGTDYQRGGKREFAGALGANGVTYNGYQYVVFYTGKDRSKANSKAQVRVGRRQIAGGNWEFSTLKNYSISSEDGHNRPVIAISKGDGVIHIAFDHHAATQFNYAKTKVGVADSPESVTWNDNVFTYQKNAGLGNNVFNQGLTRVTYPIFTSLDSGNLILYYRGGSSNNGAMIVGKYDATDHKWKFTKTFSSPNGNYNGNTKTRAPYTSRGIQVNPDGDLLVTWVWREFLGTKGCHESSREYKKCTHGLYFAKSSNEGATWQNNNGNTVANINSKNLIGITNIGKPVVDVPGNLEPTNVGNTSAVDPKTGDMHVMLSHKKRASDAKAVIHHYIGTPKGKWTGGPSDFDANGAAIRFVGDYALAFIDRSKAQVFVAKRSEKFQTWREIDMPKLPIGNNKTQKAAGGFITWDTSRLETEGVASILWHFDSSDLLKGEPSAIWTYDVQVMDK